MHHFKTAQPIYAVCTDKNSGAQTESESSRQERQRQTRRTPRCPGLEHRTSRVLTSQHHPGAGRSTWHTLEDRQVAVSGGSNAMQDYDLDFLNYQSLMINDGRQCGVANPYFFGASASPRLGKFRPYDYEARFRHGTPSACSGFVSSFCACGHKQQTMY
jgi:hypothetical protein